MDMKKSLAIFVLCFSLLAKSWGKPFNEYEVADDNDGQSASDMIYKANLNAKILDNIFEEDILLDPERRFEVEELIHGTITKRAAKKSDEFKWPNNTIYYDFVDYTHSKDNFYEAVKQIENKTCIKFVEGKTPEGYFVKATTGTGCSSYVGYERLYGQDLSIGIGCNHVGIIIHELLHALGFWHEQSRPDRDDFIEVLFENIKPGKEHNFLRRSWDIIADLQVPYDYGSVMHYGSTAFSIDPALPTIVRLDDHDLPLGRRDGLSVLDTLELNRYYKCPEAVAGMDCNFDSGLCLWSNVGDYTFTIRRGPTPSTRTGPNSDHTSGQGQYIHLEASWPAKEGDNSSIKSVPLQATTALCVTFWYSMYGTNMGTLNMDIVSETANSTSLWSKSGDQGNGWKEAKVTVESTETFDVVFVAIRGSEFRSDIALDDITFTPGPCAS